MPLSAADRKQRARIAAYAQAAKHDPKQYTKAARAAFFDRFEREVDPEGTLPPAERQRRAVAARKLYYARLSFAAAKARAARKKKAASPPATLATSSAASGVTSTETRVPNRTDSNDRPAT